MQPCARIRASAVLRISAITGFSFAVMTVILGTGWPAPRAVCPRTPEDIWEQMKEQRAFRSFMEIALEEARAAGYFKADPFIIRRFLTGALSWSTTWFRPEGPMSLDQLAHEALSLVIKDS